MSDTFEFKGVTYHLPHTVEVFGKGLPFYGTSAVTFTEMADLQLAVSDLTAGGMKAAPMLVAVVCREAGKPYNEAATIALAKEFEQLPMSVFWQVFFSFNEVLKNWLELSLQSLTEQHQQQTERLQRLTGQRSGHTYTRLHGRGWLEHFSRLSSWIYTHFTMCYRKIGRTLKKSTD